jgi:hypothetical protein
MLVVGVRCANDKLDWAVVDGAQRSDTSAIVHRQVTIPAGHRGELLAVDGANGLSGGQRARRSTTAPIVNIRPALSRRKRPTASH